MLLCGGFIRLLQSTIMWFSSGGTKSVLHHDSTDNINCLLDGQKELVMIDKKYAADIEADDFVAETGYSKVDVDKVDLYKFPRLRNLPWWNAKMEAGDCLYIPYRWYHQVRSYGNRNLAVNIWFVHLLHFNQTDCDSDTDLPQYQKLDKFKQILHPFIQDGGDGTTGSNENARMVLFEHFEDKDVITMDDMLDVFLDPEQIGMTGITIEDISQLFSVVDENKDMLLTWDEVYKADINQIIHDFPFLFGIGLDDQDEKSESETDHDEDRDIQPEHSNENHGDNIPEYSRGETRDEL